MKKAPSHKRRTSQKSRRQMSSVSTVSTIKIRSGRYEKTESMNCGTRVLVADCGAPNLTTIRTEEQFTIHAASESLSTRMVGAGGAKLKRHRYTLKKHFPDYVEREIDGIIYLDGIDVDFIRPWIKRQRTQVASKQSGSSCHVQPVERLREEYRTSELDNEQTRKLYGDHRPRRLNRGSRNGSRERCVDDMPTVNEIDRCEATADGIREYEMPIDGHLATQRKLASLPDDHQQHIDNLPA